MKPRCWPPATIRKRWSLTDFDEAIDRVVAGLQKKNRVMNAQEKEIVAFHESGHAIVAESVEHADPVHKISIIPRGIAALGYTQQQPTEDRYLMTRSELRPAGRSFGRPGSRGTGFNEISTGAQNDLQRATDIARSMVTEYGMSDRLGLVSYERPRQAMFLPESFLRAKNYSEAKAAQIDDEVSRFVDEAHQRVRRDPFGAANQSLMIWPVFFRRRKACAGLRS
jgi:cell division protease FtsH